MPVQLATTLRLSGDVRRFSAAAKEQGMDLRALSDAQAMLHETFPDARTHLGSYTATKDPETRRTLYRLTYKTAVLDDETHQAECIYTEFREVIVYDDPRSPTNPIPYSRRA